MKRGEIKMILNKLIIGFMLLVFFLSFIAEQYDMAQCMILNAIFMQLLNIENRGK